MTAKLNSMRLLDSQQVPYSVHQYHYNVDDPPDAVAVAAQLGIAAHLVYKTLVVAESPTSKRPALVMLPADQQLDLKRCAAALGVKRLDLLPRDATERLTGLKVGGIGALALTAKRWGCYLDGSAALHPQIYINAGQRGTMIGIAVADLLRLTQAQFVLVTSTPQ